MGGETSIGGRTRWRRFILTFVPAVGAVATVLALMATGVVAAPMVISGQQFKVSASSLTAYTDTMPAFEQWGEVDLVGSSPSTGVAVTYLPNGADMPNLTQTVCGATNIPVTGMHYLLVELTADEAKATGGLTVDVVELSTDKTATATFQNIRIGIPVTGRSGAATFGQVADGFTINGNLHQTAVYTQAGTFALSNLHLKASLTDTCP